MLKQADIEKLLSDFITYANINLTWFNLNFILCCMPPIVLFGIEPIFGDAMISKEEEETGMSFKWIVYSFWGCHVLQFLTKIEVYTHKPRLATDLS